MWIYLQNFYLQGLKKKNVEWYFDPFIESARFRSAVSTIATLKMRPSFTYRPLQTRDISPKYLVTCRFILLLYNSTVPNLYIYLQFLPSFWRLLYGLKTPNFRTSSSFSDVRTSKVKMSLSGRRSKRWRREVCWYVKLRQR